MEPNWAEEDQNATFVCLTSPWITSPARQEKLERARRRERGEEQESLCKSLWTTSCWPRYWPKKINQLEWKRYESPSDSKIKIAHQAEQVVNKYPVYWPSTKRVHYHINSKIDSKIDCKNWLFVIFIPWLVYLSNIFCSYSIFGRISRWLKVVISRNESPCLSREKIKLAFLQIMINEIFCSYYIFGRIENVTKTRNLT